MRKNRMMRLASILMIAVLMTTCTISGTFAKYTTSVESKDEARVAKWGFEPAAMNITGLFAQVYDLTGDEGAEVASSDASDVIAPGTTGSAVFAFAYDEANGINAPEVDYTFKVDTTGSECDATIQANGNIQWKLDSGEWGTWTQLMYDIACLSGSGTGECKYEAGSLPAGFGTGDTPHTVSWRWIFSNSTAGDALDTEMGNADDLADVKLVIKITATQVG